MECVFENVSKICGVYKALPFEGPAVLPVGANETIINVNVVLYHLSDTLVMFTLIQLYILLQCKAGTKRGALYPQNGCTVN